MNNIVLYNFENILNQEILFKKAYTYLLDEILKFKDKFKIYCLDFISNLDEKYVSEIKFTDKILNSASYSLFIDLRYVFLNGEQISFLIDEFTKQKKSNLYINKDIFIIDNSFPLNDINIIKTQLNNKLNHNYHLNKLEEIDELIFLQKQLKKNILASLVKKNVIVHDFDTVYVDNKSFIHEGVNLYPNVIIINSCIEEGVIIYENSRIINSRIGKNSIIKSSYIEDSFIEENVSIGPFSHLRNETTIKKYTQIGNFVEIKKSIIGESTNIKHLTYVGDTISGDRVNYGCGVITVNYDGKKKHQTVIGNDVFIGCNTSLVAPLEIGNNCFIAAGSTITTSLEDYDFSIARSYQITKKNYSSKYKAETR